jgi:hypothetical protein
MRWSESMEFLSLDARGSLINAIAVGLGSTALAAQRAARDRDVAAVERAAAAAHDALSRCLQLFPPDLVAGGDEVFRVPMSVELPALPWRRFLDAQPEGEAAALRRDLEQAVDQGSQAAQTIQTDGDAAAIAAHLVATRDILARLHSRLAGSSTR